MDAQKNQAAIRKMDAYIKKYGAPPNLRFDICVNEVFALIEEQHPMDAISFAFLFGRAKGYRQAILDMRKTA